MDEDKQRTKTIGDILTARRVSSDPRHHRKRDDWVKTVRTITGMDKPKRTIVDLETGARDSYRPDTLAALEKAYRLYPGTLGPALKGTGQLITDDGKVLYPDAEPPRLPEPDPFEEWARQLAHDVKKAARHLAPEEAEEIMATAGAQALLAVDAELYRRGHRKKQA